MKNLRPETVFLIISLVFGIGFAVLTPPFQVPDEAFHLFRSWEISQGKLEENTEHGQTSKVVPKSLVEFLTPFLRILYQPQEKVDAADILKFRHQALDPDDTKIYSFISTAPHPALPYLPQTLAMLAGEALKLSPFCLFYLGRLFNFALWLGLVYCAVRIIPMFRWVFVALALSPMSLHQAASLSPDAMTNGLAFLLIAWILKWTLLDAETPRIQKFGGTVFTSLSLTFSKLVYLGHALLFFLIPRNKFASKKGYFLFIGTVLSTHAIAIWLLLHGDHFASRPETQAQSAWIHQHPLGFLGLLAKTLRIQTWYYLRQYVGIFGHLDTPLPRPLTVFYLLFVGIVVSCDRGTVRKLRGWEKSWLIGIAALEILAILASIFITWTRPGASIVLGVQGRYFIPVVPLLLLPFYRPRKTQRNDDGNWLAPYCLYGMAMVLTVSLFVLKVRFYR